MARRSRCPRRILRGAYVWVLAEMGDRQDVDGRGYISRKKLYSIKERMYIDVDHKN